MDAVLKRNAKARPRMGQTTLNLTNLPMAKLVNGELQGDAYLIKDVELKDVSTKIYNQAKRQNVKVTLVSTEEGVMVFRVRPDGSR